MIRRLSILSLFLSAPIFCSTKTSSALKQLAQNPTNQTANLLLAKEYQKQNQTDKAITQLKKMLRQKKQFPNCLAAYQILTNLLKEKKKYDDAISVALQGLNLFPNDISLLFSCGLCATMVGKTIIALETYEKILQLRPNNANVLYNIGYVLRMRGNTQAAIDMYQKTLQINPDYKSAKFSLALAHLNNGDFQKGWKRYADEHLKAANINTKKLHNWFEQEKLYSKRILIHPQGGLGDMMLFCRYVQELQKKGAYTILLTKKPLAKLLSLCPYVDEIVTSWDQVKQFDCETTVMALPALFNSSEKTIPKKIPYLFADEHLLQKWKKFFSRKNNKKLKVGINWTADLHNDSSRPPVAHRSIPLKLLQPLGKLSDDIEFYSLQKGSEKKVKISSDGLVIHGFPELDTKNGAFMDTAAIMHHLDLVITVDTSIAHLAGGLGIPVWTILPYSVDWRWVANRTDSPWYPTMKLFRQKTPMNWKPVIKSVMQALEKKTEIFLQKNETETKNIQSLFSQANDLYAQHNIEQALTLYKKIDEILPNNPAILHNIGFALAELNRPHEAVQYYEHVLAQKPDHAGAHFNAATAYLASGNYKKGWQEYEWRWKHHNKKLSDLPLPVWNGSDLFGKTILLRSEGALGDCMQFVRYAQLIKNQGAYIILQTLTPLKKLFSFASYIDEVISFDEQNLSADFQISLMSLPHRFDTQVNTIPNEIPYLYADKTLAKRYKKLFDKNFYNIGICWQADQKNDIQRPPLAQRTINVELFAQLNEIPNVQLFSLQVNKKTNQKWLYEFGPDFDSTNGRFIDTAAVIKNLDLVITVDTSIAHLAGALGVKTWVLLPFKSDWRWMTERTDSPWYPNMRLYRNKKTTDWKQVMEQVKKSLKKEIQ